HVRDLQAREPAEPLLEGHEVGERLARVVPVRQCVDDRDGRRGREPLDVLVRKGPYDERASEPADDLSGVLDRLASAELQLVGSDGSDSSRIALRWALAEARLRSARLAVVHGWHTPTVFIPSEYRAELVEMARIPDAVIEFIDTELDAVGADAETGVQIERRPIQHFAARA